MHGLLLYLLLRSHRLESYSVSSRDFRCLDILFPLIPTVFNQFPMSQQQTTTTTTLFTLVHTCINKHWKELKKEKYNY